jgi:trehalose utilization protein
MINVTVWNEFRHERESEKVKSIYPNGIHEAIAEGLRSDEALNVRCATMDEPENGLPESVLESTDVLIWWGHKAHHVVEDEVVKRVQQRILAGMGLIVLHSGHYSKIFRTMMGTNCSLLWREDGAKERLWVTSPGHPIARGLGAYFELPNTEMYGEHFDIPTPDDQVFISWFQGGEVFRSGCTWRRGNGKIFYFRPGHETFPIYFDANVRLVIGNAVHWAASNGFYKRTDKAPNSPALETLPDYAGETKGFGPA